MRKQITTIIITSLIIIVMVVTGVKAGWVGNVFSSELAGTIGPLSQWKSTSTPFTAITTQTYGANVYLTGNATTSLSHYIGGDLTVNGNISVDGSWLAVGNTPTVQRHYSSTQVLTNAYADLTTDTTNIENNTDIVRVGLVDTNRIDVRETGLYEIHYHCYVTKGSAQDYAFHAYVNNNTEVPGSYGYGKVSSTGNETVSVTAQYYFTAGDYVKIQGYSPLNSSGSATEFTWSVKRLSGIKGDKGDVGGNGSGDPGAWNNLWTTAITPTSSDAGIFVKPSSTIYILRTDSLTAGNASTTHFYTPEICLGDSGSPICQTTWTTGATIWNYFSAGDYVALSTSTTNIYSASNIGIGTTTPNAFLEIATTTTHWAAGVRPLMRVATKTTESFYIGASGNVGIGTTAPLGKLDLRGDVFTDRWLKQDTNTFLGMSVVGNGTLAHVSGDQGYYNTGLGSLALNSITSGNSNTAFGYQACSGVSSGGFNVCIGRDAGWGITTGISNFALGTSAGKFGAGQDNVAIGSSAMADSAGLNSSVGIGANALYRNKSSNYNIAIGYNTGWGLETGGGNTLVGPLAGQGEAAYNATGNTFIGYLAGYKIGTNGSNNIAIGYQTADDLTTGTKNIVIGYDIDLPANNSSNMLDIGNLIYGTGISSIGTAVSTGNVGIGTTAPLARLHSSSTTEQLRLSNGTVASTNLTAFTVLSAGDLIIDPQGTATTTFVWSGLKVEGNHTTTQSMTIGSLLNCDTIDTDANGLLKCGTDADTGGTGGWATDTEQYFWNNTTTWTGFQGEFNNKLNATTTYLNYNSLSNRPLLWATDTEQYFWNNTTTWTAFTFNFNTLYNATTTQTNFTPNWNTLHNATTTYPGFQTQFDTAINASSTIDNWDYLKSKPATSTILGFLDTDYRIAKLFATSTLMDKATITATVDAATFCFAGANCKSAWPELSAGTWDDLTNKPATSTILNLLDTHSRIAVVNATTTNTDVLKVYTSVDFPANAISDAMVSNTLTCSDLQAGSAVVADSEVVDALTINTSIEGIFTGNIRANRINATSSIIDNLFSTSARIATLNATTTNIDDIFATRGRIATLNATTTNIDRGTFISATTTDTMSMAKASTSAFNINSLFTVDSAGKATSTKMCIGTGQPTNADALFVTGGARFDAATTTHTAFFTGYASSTTGFYSGGILNIGGVTTLRGITTTTATTTIWGAKFYKPNAESGTTTIEFL